MTLEETIKAAQTELFHKMEADKATYLALMNMSVALTRADETKRAAIADEFAAMGLQ